MPEARTTKKAKQALREGKPPSTAAGAFVREEMEHVRAPTRRWSRAVTERSNAMDLEESVFLRPPTEIAQSLKRSAEASTRLKASPFRSAMSMLTFYENRAGRNLSATRRAALEEAKAELRKIFGRPAQPRHR
jgi:hypothetical protein